MLSQHLWCAGSQPFVGESTFPYYAASISRALTCGKCLHISGLMGQASPPRLDNLLLAVCFDVGDDGVGDHRQLRPAPRRCRSPGNARRWTAPHGWPAASPASTIAPNTPHGGPKSTAFPNWSGSTACGVLAQSERCAKSVLTKRIIRASGVLRGLTSCRYSWPMVGGTLQSVTSHESVLFVDAALL